MWERTSCATAHTCIYCVHTLYMREQCVLGHGVFVLCKELSWVLKFFYIKIPPLLLKRRSEDRAVNTSFHIVWQEEHLPNKMGTAYIFVISLITAALRTIILCFYFKCPHPLQLYAQRKCGESNLPHCNARVTHTEITKQSLVVVQVVAIV